jgi:NAD(P)-dependent dehydrogenase (short-subunit alcohol dehydrogenase family)
MAGELSSRVALITGASRGLGAAVAVELCRLGAHVVITARTQGGLEETDDAVQAAGGTATLLPLDLREPDKIEAIAPSIVARFGRLDILVHAAGVLGKLTPVSHALPQDRDEVLAVNVLAAWRLIQGCGPYGASKAAAANLVLTWAGEIAFTPLRVNLFDPGPMRTRLRAAAFPGEEPASVPLPDEAAAALVRLCLPTETRHGEAIRHR